MTSPIMSREWLNLITSVDVYPKLEGVWRRKRDNKKTIVHGYYRGGWVWYRPDNEPNTQQTFDGFVRDYERFY